MRLKGDAPGLAPIGRDLACRYVLEGSVRRAANTLPITARLVDAPNDVQLWANRYGGMLDDVFEIQERVSRFDRGMIRCPSLSEHDLYLENIRGEARFRQAMESGQAGWERLEV